MIAAAEQQDRTHHLTWFKSSYSSNEGGDCVELAYASRTSARGSGDGGTRSEVSSHPCAIHVRDSKNIRGPVLTVSPGAWAGFLGRLGD